MFSRTERVIGKDKLSKINNSNIAIIGVGGVGGYIAEMLVRMGVENLTIVDFDKVEKSNLNRQIIALQSTLGKYKVDALKQRLEDINTDVKIKSFCEKLGAENIPKILFNNFDYVIDAIDDLPAKVALAKFCEEKKINIISSMGTGNRYKMPKFEICDIFKTDYDKLAKKMRKMLKEEGVNKLKVCYTKEAVEKTEALGSVVYYPLVCAGTIVSFVINELIK